MDSKLPESWIVTPLGDLLLINPRLDKSQISDNTEVSFVPMPAVGAETGTIDVTETKVFSVVKKGYTTFLEGDVLFAKITPCMENGKMAVVPKLKNNLGFGSTEFHVLRSPTGVIPSYVYYFVSSKTFRVDAEHNMTGAVGQRRVPTAYLEAAQIPLPPYNEQKRIVAKIEELFSELDNGIAALKTAREQLKVYRQAVLKHAFEGKLTAKWRDENADKLETPEQLLSCIQQEREARYQEQLEEWKQAVKEWEANGKEGKKPGKPKNNKLSIVGLVDEINVPDEWACITVGELNVDVFDGPFGSNLKSSDYVEDGVRVIRLENIGQMEFIDDKYSFVAEEKYEQIKKHTVRGGDIIFSSFITDGIMVVVLPPRIDKAINKADCFCIRVCGKNYDSRFLAWYLSSRTAFKQVESEIHGIGRPRINTTQLKSFVVPLCSMEEQKQVMAAIDFQLSEIETTANDIESQLFKAETLRQSILKKALSGQLVAQDPNDEPANELLTRIKAEVATKKEKSTKKMPAAKHSCKIKGVEA